MAFKLLLFIEIFLYFGYSMHKILIPLDFLNSKCEFSSVRSTQVTQHV